MALTCSGKMLVAAHRGDSFNHYENTMGAFRAAIESGADMIETDVLYSAAWNLRVPVHGRYGYRFRTSPPAVGKSAGTHCDMGEGHIAYASCVTDLYGQTTVTVFYDAV